MSTLATMLSRKEEADYQSAFPAVMSYDRHITVATETKSPYQWAAALAPDGKITEYKNAMLWLEGEVFTSQDEFLAKVARVIKYQEAENHTPQAILTPPVVQVELDTTPTTPIVQTAPKDDAWTTVTKPKKAKPKGPARRWTIQEVGTAIAQGCIGAMKRTFAYAGPSLRISDVYPNFNTQEFESSAVIGAVRNACLSLDSPDKLFPVGKKARYRVATSAGKGRNFNFKVQRPDSKAVGGYSAAAQIHVLWQ